MIHISLSSSTYSLSSLTIFDIRMKSSIFNESGVETVVFWTGEIVCIYCLEISELVAECVESFSCWGKTY